MADTFARYHCNYCEDNIVGLRIKCVECEDFDLCLKCFSFGAQIGKHLAGHDYQFMDTGQYSLFGSGNSNSSWTAREEVRLLDAIEQYGYGNWEDISRHIETKTADEARLKYIGCYIEGNIGKATWGPAMEMRQLPIEHTNAEEGTDPEAPEGPLSPSLPTSLKSSSCESIMMPEVTPEQAAALGSLQLRDDFDREWDNEAECTVAPLFLHATDDEDVDIALKLAQVDMYMRNLRERTRRKRVVKDFQIIQQFFKKEQDKHQYPQGRKKQKEEREVISEKLRGLSQFQTASEHHNLVSSLLKEKQLRTRIRELNRYRRNGIKHVEECYEFDTARARRDKRKDLKKKASLTLTHPPETMKDPSLLRQKENGERNLKCLGGKKCTALDTGGGKWHSESCSDSSSSHQSMDGTLPPPDIRSLPGYFLLSQQERLLCASLNLKPSQYISYKAAILKESFEGSHSSCTRGSGLLSGAWRPPGLDSQAQHTIQSFLTQAGWITSEG